MQTLGSSAGYEVARDGDLIWFAHRGTRAPALVAWIGGGVSLITGANGLILGITQIAGGHASRGAILLASFLGASVVAGLVARAGFRSYRRRRDAPVVDLAILRADLAAGELQTPAGDRLADLAEVRIDTPRNLGDSTQGSMRWIRLRWPGGGARVFSSASSRAQALAEQLAAAGAGHRA